RRRHTGWPRDWSSDVCSSDLRFRQTKRSLIRPPAASARPMKNSQLATTREEEVPLVSATSFGNAPAVPTANANSPSERWPSSEKIGRASCREEGRAQRDASVQ